MENPNRWKWLICLQAVVFRSLHVMITLGLMTAFLKLVEMAKLLLGRYSQQQGLYGKEACRLSNFAPESWGFLKLQFGSVSDDSSVISAGKSTRIRRH